MFKLGLGVGLEGYKFKNAVDLIKPVSGASYFEEIVTTNETYRKSKLAVSYAELPMEFQFRNNWLYPIKFSIGGKFGYMFGAHMKHKYEDPDLDSGPIKEKTFRDGYNLKPDPIGYLLQTIFLSFWVLWSICRHTTFY